MKHPSLKGMKTLELPDFGLVPICLLSFLALKVLPIPGDEKALEPRVSKGPHVLSS